MKKRKGVGKRNLFLKQTFFRYFLIYYIDRVNPTSRVILPIVCHFIFSSEAGQKISR